MPYFLRPSPLKSRPNFTCQVASKSYSQVIMWLLLFSSLSFSEELNLPDSLALVEQENVEVHIARLESEKAHMEKLLALSRLLPAVEGNSAWLNYGEPLEAHLIGDGSEDIDCAPFDAFGLSDLCASFSDPMLLREDKVFDGSIRILYSISALYSIPQGYRSAILMAEAADIQILQTKKRIQLSVIELYMEALHLQRVIQFAAETQRRLTHHKTNIQAFVDQGFVNPIEITRLEKAMLEAQIGQEEAESGYRLLCRQLELLVGVPVTPLPLQHQLQMGDSISAQEHELIQIAQLQADAAAAMTKAAYGLLLPSVTLVGGQTLTSGQGPLTPTSQQYVGLSVNGTFSWGDKWVQVQKMKKDKQMAEKAVALQESALLVQQEAAREAWLIADKKLDVAQKQVELSTEIRRQAESTFQQQLLTTAELLDSESEYLRAQLALAAAESQLVIAQARYQYATERAPFLFIDTPSQTSGEE